MDQRARASNLKPAALNGVRPGRISRVRSFWSYYSLAAFAAVLTFTLVFAAMFDGREEIPVLIAAAAAGFCVIGFVFVREIFLRRAREREVLARRLSHHLREAGRHRVNSPAAPRLSLQRNDEILLEIRKKSDAARVLGQLPDAHREVFELCDDYLKVVSEELPNARAGSPRIPALRKGSAAASKHHRFHMLKWAELKSRDFTLRAANADLGDRIKACEHALEAVERAVAAYPDEMALTDSRLVLTAYLSSARVMESIENAESAEAGGENGKAVEHYEAALTKLNDPHQRTSENDAMRVRIASEIERLRGAGS